MPPLTDLPVIIIGAGPIGLAAAAHLRERDQRPVVLEAGTAPGETISQWGHTRLFSPWCYNIDDAARRLLETTQWRAPDPDQLPTGHELVQDYLLPLADTLGEVVQTRTQVLAVSRAGIDKTRSTNRAETPLVVRVRTSDGTIEELLARSVLDASGTWHQPNPLGQSGLPAPGEDLARTHGLISDPLPDVHGAERDRFAHRHVLVVGAGHSAANTLLDLADLAEQAPGTQISWAVRGKDVTKVYGGEAHDELAARGALGTRLRQLVESGTIDLHTQCMIRSFDSTPTGLTVCADTPDGPTELAVDTLVPATGFRPDLRVLSELRLELDPAVEAPRQLGPLIDPEFHSCGSVKPHGERILAHPEPGFYIVGMKSYGRAPTFLMATGYEQVRSIAAALAGDRAAADDVHLDLPETGVCSANFQPPVTLQEVPAALPFSATGCCS